MEYINSILLLLGIINIIVAVKKKLLLYFIFQSVFIILVSGQAVWFAYEINNEYDYNYVIGYNSFSVESALFASYLFIIFQIIFIFLTVFTKRSVALIINSNRSIKIRDDLEKLIYILTSFIVPFLMMKNAGGPLEFFSNPGALIAGQTFLLIALGILKWNLLSRIMYGLEITKFSISIFFIYITVTLFTSRFLTIFALLQLLLVVNYYKKKVSFKSIILTSLVIFMVLLIFGLYRDVAHNRPDISFFTNDFYMLYIDRLSHVIQWFYTLNSEVYFGLASAINKLQHDSDLSYLIPEINFIFLLIPNSIRVDNEIIQNAISYLASFGNLSDSVISSGFERFYLGLGLFGFILYSFIVLIFLAVSEKNLEYRKLSFISIASIQSINSLRGSLFGALIFFGIGDFLAQKIFNLLIKK